MKYIKKGILYYWYTGEKKIAVVSGIATSIINLLFLTVTSGGSAAILAILLVFDHLIILLILGYIVIRNFIPSIAINKLDEFFLKNFIFLIIAWIVSRFITNVIAEKVFKKELQ